MSENIIYCYSGSGNCLSMAKNIAKELGDTDIVMMCRKHNIHQTQKCACIACERCV